MILYLLVIFLLLLLGSPKTRWFLSKTINIVLQLRYPIRHHEDRSSIPGLSFEWANGQGTEKFFHGHVAARRWRASLGPIYRIWSGFRPEVVLTQPSHVRPYFRNSNHHVKAADNNSGWLFGEILGSCVGLVSGQRWQVLRGELEPFFTQAAATAHTTTFVEAARDFVSNQLPTPSLDDEKVTSIVSVNPARDLQFFPFFVVAGFLFGEPLSHEQKAVLRDLAPLREELFREVIRGGINRWGVLARWFGSRGAKLLVQFQTRWLQFVEEAYEHAKQVQKKSGEQDPRDGNVPSAEMPAFRKELPIIRLWDAVLQGRISKRECLQTLDESLYANLDVTTNAISWLIILLAQHPDVQSQLRAEIRDAAHSDAVTYARYMDRGDTLLAACVIEASRLRPILRELHASLRKPSKLIGGHCSDADSLLKAFSNPEASPTEDMIIDGYTIPRNTNVVIDSHAINVTNKFWIDGEKFNPKRHFALRKEATRYNLWRFGFGPRQCLGKHVAERMLRCVAAEMVGRYALSVSVPDKTGTKGVKETARDFSLQEESWVGLPDVVVRCEKV